MEQDLETQILKELRRDEKELKTEEKRVKIMSSVVLLLILILFSGVFYLIFYSQKSIIQTIVKEVPKEISVSASPSPTPISTLSNPDSTSTQSSNSTKDYYINIGSGVNESIDWADVAGTLTTIDLGQHKNIKEVHLETNINVPTANGTVSVRLFNKTDNYAVWNSERTVEAQSKGDLLISQNIIYDKGARLYQIQMKSQLGVTANLLQARLHVITNE